MVWGIFGKTELVMKTDIKNFPKGLDEKDLLYLIWKALLVMQGGSSDGGSDSSDSDSGGGCSCLAPMIVQGTTDGDTFTPGEGSASWSDAQEQMFNGGLLYLVIIVDGEPFAVDLATVAYQDSIGAPTDEGFIFWNKPSDQSDASSSWQQ